MASVEVKVPQLSESVAEATLLEWKKKVGDVVARDEVLVEIETDKVVLEVPAPEAGVISQIARPDGSTVVSDELIATIDTAARTGAQAPATLPATPPAVAAPVAAPLAAGNPASAQASRGAGIAMPAAAKLLAEHNLSAAQVPGSGRDGRVTKADVLSAVAQPPDARVNCAGWFVVEDAGQIERVAADQALQTVQHPGRIAHAADDFCSWKQQCQGR